MSINWAPVQVWPRTAKAKPSARRSPTRVDTAKQRAPREPRKHLVVVACMDTRLDMAALGLRPGDAHIIRNAGAFVSGDVLRSIAISQEKLRTRRILLVAHTDCGALLTDQRAFTADLARSRRQVPPWEVDLASTPSQALATGRRAIEDCPFLAHKQVETAIYDVETQTVRVDRR